MAGKMRPVGPTSCFCVHSSAMRSHSPLATDRRHLGSSTFPWGRSSLGDPVRSPRATDRSSLDIFPYRNMISVARAATTADAFNAVAEPRRRADPRRPRRRRAPRQRPRARARPGPAAGVQAPARAARSGSGRRARRRTAAPLPAQRPRAQAHPRLGEELRAPRGPSASTRWTPCWKTSSEKEQGDDADD